MVGRADTRHLVAAEEKRVLPFIRQRPDATLRQAVVYCVVPVFPVQENLVPDMVDVQHLIVQVQVHVVAVCLQRTQFTTESFSRHWSLRYSITPLKN